MDFSFTDQQLQFRDAVRSFLVVEATPENLRDYWETDSGRSTEMRQKITAQGVTALSVPEAYGGLGLGDIDWVLILQQVGYHGLPDSLSDAAYLSVGILNDLPDDNHAKKEWLPRMVEGQARMSVSHPINPYVHDAEFADLILLWHEDSIHATTPDQVELTAATSIDPSRRLYKLEWQPTEATRICTAERGAAIWAQAINRANIAAAAQLVGLSQCMLDLSIDYAAQRKQFGKPIGAFQAVKHQLADVAVEIEFAKPVLHRAAAALDANDPRAGVHVSHAKLAASRAAQLAMRKGVQAHGAMGYTWEADLQMYLKRALTLIGAWGDSAFHKGRIAEFVFADGAPLGPGETFTV